MRVVINGEAVELAGPCSVLYCLEARGLKAATVVVERNKEIVPSENFAHTKLEEGDVLEILHFVGGG